MNKDVEFLIWFSVWVAVVVATFCAIIFTVEKPRFLGDIEREGRAVAGVLVGLIWPVVVIAFLLANAPRVLRGFCRGASQLYRAVAKRPKLPRAEVRR